jgi:peptidoglycan biosynthesis protein MviN/MurJ (putative lipid II flippase)
MVLIFWICTALLFYYLASSGFKVPPRDWGSREFAGGAWISIVVMFIIAIIISFIFGISLEDIIVPS